MTHDESAHAGPLTERPDDREITCETIGPLLPEYLTRREQRIPETPTDQAIVAHLRTCADCRAALEEIAFLFDASVNGQIAPALTYPGPNLSFLRKRQAATPPTTIDPVVSDDPVVSKQQPTQPRPSFMDALGRLIITFSQELFAQLQQPTLAGAMRGRTLYRYEHQRASEHDPHVTIDVLSDEQSSEHGRVVVRVIMPEREAFDQGGTQVALYAKATTLQGRTNDAGRVVFDALPLNVLPTLRVEITPAQPP